MSEEFKGLTAQRTTPFTCLSCNRSRDGKFAIENEDGKCVCAYCVTEGGSRYPRAQKNLARNIVLSNAHKLEN